MLTYVLASDGSPLMPTYDTRKVRRKLRSGQAVIAGHSPGFTIRLTYALPEQEAPHVQPIELCEDTGDHHVGLSIKSEKHEFVHAQYDLLPDEKQKHDDQRRYRRGRRNRKRYRKPKGLDQNKPKGWFAPTLEHKMDCHVALIERYAKVLPVTKAVLETARFDTQALEAAQAGKPIPQGSDYQHGPRYGLENLRMAVFTRDHYTCQVCGRSVEDGAVLRMHHALYWKGDHTDRMSGLMTACTKCHTPANHAPGGKLWGVTPKVRSMAPAAFMNSVRWKIMELVRKTFPELEVESTNGVHTKLARKRLHVAKTHANDAYCMGGFHPRHHAAELHYEKRRRNHRILAKFYDARYVDVRDGKKASGGELGSNRTDRSVPRDNPRNLRRFRGEKLASGKTTVRKRRYPIQKDDMVKIDGVWHETSGCHNHGTRIMVDGKSISVAKVTGVIHAGGWRFLPAQ